MPFRSNKKVWASKLAPCFPELVDLDLDLSEPLVRVVFEIERLGVTTVRCSAQEERVWCHIVHSVLPTLDSCIDWSLVCQVSCRLEGSEELAATFTAASAAPFRCVELAGSTFQVQFVPFVAAYSSRLALSWLSRKAYKSLSRDFAPMKLVPGSDQTLRGWPLIAVDL